MEEEDCPRKHLEHFFRAPFSELAHDGTAATDDLTPTRLLAETRERVAQRLARDHNQPLEWPIQLKDHEDGA